MALFHLLQRPDLQADEIERIKVVAKSLLDALKDKVQSTSTIGATRRQAAMTSA